MAQWMKDDWKLFLESDKSDQDLLHLLQEITGDRDITRKRYVRDTTLDRQLVETWGIFREELMYENRWFVEKAEGAVSRIRRLIAEFRDQFQVSLDGSTTWYRARIRGQTVHHSKDLGAPPKERSGRGRANPEGIPYLYLASTNETAVTEVRPDPGALVSVGTFEGIKGAFADLTDPRRTASPFGLDSAESVTKLASLLPFMESFASQLATPVVPDESKFEYIPTQYMCEYFKSLEFSGVQFSSSVGDGINLTVFNPADLLPSKIEVFSVKKVSVDLDCLNYSS